MITKRKKQTYRQYSDEDKAAALALLKANDGNLSKTSRELDIPVGTINRWAKGSGYHPVVLQLQAGKEAGLSDLFELVVRRYLNQALTDEVIESTSGQSAVMTAAIATDKMRLLREQATSIAGKAEPSDGELLERLRRLAERIKARRILTADGGGPTGTELSSPALREIAGPVEP